LRHNPLVDPRELAQLHDESFSWALTCTRGQRAEAEEVLQMTYLAIIEGRARFGGQASLRTWLFAVIRNHAYSRWRRGRRTLQALTRLASFAADERDETSAARYQAAQDSHRVLRAWQALAPRQREVLDLVFYRDLSIAEAATVLGVSLGTARVHYERGKATLRRELGMDAG
jgi:RNA polymerase sigma factor (sigma-70 family)